MKLKRILRSKRGATLSNAVFFMLIIFSLCTLLSLVAITGHYQIKLEKNVLLKDVAIDQIGDDYLASVRAGEEFSVTYEQYSYEVLGNSLTVWRKNDASRTAVLYVEVSTADSNAEVTVWRYSLPTKTE